MSEQSVFQITYWGTTGTLSAPLRPDQVTEKIVRCITQLVNEGRLHQLAPTGDHRQLIEQMVEELPLHMRSTYGGNTTCVEVRTPDGLFIVDCGSGFRELGRSLQQRWNDSESDCPRKADVLLTHPHFDHTLATPFFGPYYNPRNEFTIWGTVDTLNSLRAILSPVSDLSNVYFPPTFDLMKGVKELNEIQVGQELTFGSTTVRTCPLNHPGGCLAFRFECQGKSFVFASDHEQAKVPDPGLTVFAKGADLLYTEGQYTEAEYLGEKAIPGEGVLPRKGWGHSPVEACVKLAVAAGVRTLHIGHHDPARKDEELMQMEKDAQELLEKLLAPLQPQFGECELIIPCEGLTIEL